MVSAQNVAWPDETGRRYVIGTARPELKRWSKQIAEKDKSTRPLDRGALERQIGRRLDRSTGAAARYAISITEGGLGSLGSGHGGR